MDLSKEELRMITSAINDDITSSLNKWSGAVKNLIIEMIETSQKNPEEFQSTYGTDWKESLEKIFTFEPSKIPDWNSPS